MKETSPPDGYVLTGDGTFYVKVDSNGVKLLEKIIVDGKLSFTEATETSVGNVSINTLDTTATFTVENTPGASLPSTGGPGTNLLYLFGSMLVMLAGAGFVLQSRKRGKSDIVQLIGPIAVR